MPVARVRAVWLSLAIATVTGCYNPTSTRPSCEVCNEATPNCPDGLTCLGGHCVESAAGECIVVDAPSGCIDTALVGTVCLAGAPERAYAGKDLDTASCEAEGGEVIANACVILANSLTISGVGLRGRGPLPLVFASNTLIVIDGPLNVGSNGATDGAGANTDCLQGGLAGTDGTDQAGETFGGGGGGGGSYQGPGGRGGAGEKGGPLASGGSPGALQLFGLRGGCPGGSGGDTGTTNLGGGEPGAGGGAIYLIARDSITLTESAEVTAGGRGGRAGDVVSGGGGGGGSGGLIAFETPALKVTAGNPVICANGGGGGGGAELNTIASNGQDGCAAGGTMPAAGGGGGSLSVDGGDGGTGSSTVTAGASGIEGDDGGGGGGGGGGYILVFRASASDIAALGDNVSPPVTAP